MASLFVSVLVSMLLLLSTPAYKTVHAEDSTLETSNSAPDTTEPISSEALVTTAQTSSSENQGFNSSPLFLSSAATDITINIQATLAPMAINSESSDDKAYLEVLQPFREGGNETDGTAGTVETVQSGQKQDAVEIVTTETLRSTETTATESQAAGAARERTEEAKKDNGQEDQGAKETDIGRLQNDTREELQNTEAAAKPIEPGGLDGTKVDPTVASIAVLDVNSTSDTELHVATDALNVESTNSGAPNNTDSLSPHSSDESKFIDEPMLADAPNSETDASTNRDIATSIRDKISNMSDTFRKTTEEIGQAVDQGKEMLNATVASSESREKVSINNENLNPLPPSSFQSDQPSKEMGKTGMKTNTLVNNIRKSMVNTSEVMMSTANQEGTNHEVTSEMAQIKKPKSSKVKIGKGSQLETSPTEDEAESTIPSGGTVNSSVTPDPGAERVSPFHSSSSNSNGSNSSTRNSSGISPTSFNASTDTSLTSSANISTTLRNFTNSQMAQSLVNQTVQDRASLKAKNGGSRLGLVELQRSDWLTLVAMVSMTSRF